MKISYFQRAEDNNPRVGDATWDQLVSGLARHRVAECTLADCARSDCPHKNGPSWSPVSYAAGSYRGKNNVIDVGVLVVDLDHVPNDDALAEMLGRLIGTSHMMHSSHSDRDGDRCVRVLVELSRPVPGREWPRFWRAAMTQLNLPADEATKDCSRLYYLPSRPSDATYDFYSMEGTPLDVDAVLAAAPPEEARDSSSFEVPDFDGGPSDDQLFAAITALAGAWPERGRHMASLALTGALARQGWPVENIADFVAAVAEMAESGNGQLDKRLTQARASVAKVRVGEAVQGWPSLREHVASEAVDAAMVAIGITLTRRVDGFLDAISSVESPVFEAPAEPAPVSDFAAAMSAAAPTPSVGRGEIGDHLKAARDKLQRSSDPKKKRDGRLLGRLLKGARLVDHFDENEDHALAYAMLAVARAAPAGADTTMLAEFLTRSRPFDEPAFLIEKLDRARAAIRQETPEVRAKVRDDLPPPENDEELRGRLQQNKDGVPDGCGPNIEIILRYSAETRDRIRYNELRGTIEVTDGRFADEKDNGLDVGIANWLQTHWQVKVTSKQVAEQLLRSARMYGSYDPIAEYLKSLRWDGISRVRSWLTDFCGVASTEYTSVVGSKFLISAVARGLRPGCKVDTMLILEGPQGAGKSKMLAALAGEFFSSTQLALGDKDSLMQASAHWIIELAELASLSARDAEHYKAFLSSPRDDFRPPYGRVTESRARRCVFVGSTNNREYLRDPTGNRRFWAVRVGKLDVEGLEAVRDQLWAEAVHLLDQGETWWLEATQQEMANEIIAERVAENPWVGLIQDWVQRQNLPGPGAGLAKSAYTMAEVAHGALTISISDMPRMTHQIIQSMRDAGLRMLPQKKGASKRAALWTMDPRQPAVTTVDVSEPEPDDTPPKGTGKDN